MLDDGEAQARAARFAASRRIDPVEALGDAGEVLARNPRAITRAAYMAEGSERVIFVKWPMSNRFSSSPPKMVKSAIGGRSFENQRPSRRPS